MPHHEALKNISHIAINSEYFLQAAIDENGDVIASDSGIGPVPTLFSDKEKPLAFSECFLASDWTKYENHRLNAWKKSQQSFVIELNKLVYPDGSTIKTKWEFFFLTEDFGTCLGIGHPLSEKAPYDMGLGEIFDRSGDDNESLLSSVLEDRLLGFWEFNFSKNINSMSQGLAQMLGYNTEELRDAKIAWAKHIAKEDMADLMRNLSGHFKTAGNTPFKAEFRINSKNHQVRWVYCFGKTNEWDSEGHPIKLQGCMLDITERKKQEFWMQEHKHFLKKLVFDQSHSIRSKVANISGLVEIAELENDSDEARKLIGLIKKETGMLDALLKKSIRQSVEKNKAIKNQDLGPDLV